ncbi:MAG: hypothetical protein AB7E52_00670 [Bdellovibrionales bacterium]
MYLFVFTFLILSILGLYTELFSLRMAMVSSNQTIAAEAMMFWHGAVYTYVRDNKTSITTVPATGSTISLNSSVCGLPAFTKGEISGKTYLPTDYNTTNDVELNFSTILYQTNGDYFVITYLNPTAIKLGYTADQLYKQMQNADLPQVSYGRVQQNTTCIGGTNGNWLVTQEYVNGTQICYPVPSTVTAISDGATGIISNIGS